MKNPRKPFAETMPGRIRRDERKQRIAEKQGYLRASLTTPNSYN